MTFFETGWGLDVILWFQSWRTPLVTNLALFFHYLGLTEFYILVLPFVYWCISPALGRRLAVVTVGFAWSNSLLKSLFRRPRPYFMSPAVQNAVVETSYGVPSGHAQGAATFGGFIAQEARRPWVTLAAAVYILLMAASRMVLGVHYPQDVALGVVLGLLIVALYAILDRPVSAWLARQSLVTHLALVAGVTALLLVIHPVLVGVSSPEWLDEPLTTDELTGAPLTAISLFLGLGIGMAVEWRTVRFSAAGPWGLRILRFVVGLLGIAALQFGLLALVPALESGALLRLLHGALVGLWASLGAPWLFVTVGLAPGARATGQPA